MKAVLMSIQPKWCELIAHGKKTVEVRKTHPKLQTPFKVYIYQTKGKERLLDVIKDGDTIYGDVYHGKTVFVKTNVGSRLGIHGVYGRERMVIGEFVCDKIYKIDKDSVDFIFRTETDSIYFRDAQKLGLHTCVSENDLSRYLNHKQGYGLYISDLVIYDEPKMLSDFRVTGPPRSWCYVEEA